MRVIAYAGGMRPELAAGQDWSGLSEWLEEVNSSLRDEEESKVGVPGRMREGLT